MNLPRLLGTLLVLFFTCEMASTSFADSPDVELIEAANKGDLPGVRAALAAGAKVNSPSGPTALLSLLSSSRSGNIGGVAKELLEQGADINAPGPDGRSVFERMLVGPNYCQGMPMISLLTEYKPNLNFQSHEGDGVVALATLGESFLAQATDTAGHTFYYTDCLQAATRLIKLGAPVDVPNANGYTALMKIAAASIDQDSLARPGQLEFAKLLLAHGADPARKDKKGKTAADYAFAQNKYEMLLLLDVSQKYHSQYDQVRRKSSTQKLSLLVQRQAYVAAHRWSKTIDPVDTQPLIEECLKDGADPNAIGMNREMTVFGEALGGDNPGGLPILDASLISLLLKHGADPNLRLPDGRLPMELVLKQPEILTLLRARGATPDESLQLAMKATTVDIDDIREATFRYQFNRNASGQQQSAKVYFLAVTNATSERVDPSDEFMKRFASNKPRVTKKSDSGMSKKGIVADKTTGEEGLLFIVSAIKWISKDEVEVEGGYYEAGLSASGNTYYLKKKDGKWVVVKDVMHWIS